MENGDSSEKKQAYLIIAHKDDLVFRTLLKMLDDSRNDIFIHMDSKNKSYKTDQIIDLVHHSHVYHAQRTSVTWGGYSQINAEIILLKMATTIGKYQHYHLLSGSDLPIKSQDDIIDFFEKNEAKEFIEFQDDNFLYWNRIQYFYPFQEVFGRCSNKMWIHLNRLILAAQRGVGIKRNKGISFQKGTNWFSITDALARYVVEKEDWIRGVFMNTVCCDEVFLQTLVINSSFLANLYHTEFNDDKHAIMRLIDWKRGSPYVFRQSDWNEIIESEMLFARKFDENLDKEIILKISKEFVP